MHGGTAMTSRFVITAAALLALSACGSERGAPARLEATPVPTALAPSGGTSVDAEDPPTEGAAAAVHQLWGSRTCADAAHEMELPGRFVEVRFGGGPRGTSTTTLGGHSFTLAVAADGSHFDWSATGGVDFVIAGGSSLSKVYVYDPEAFSAAGLAPPAALDGSPVELRYATFCLDYEVTVTNVAETTPARRTWTWTLEEAANASAMTIPVGGYAAVTYTVTATATAVDTGASATGTVTVANPAPSAAELDLELQPELGGWTGAACIASVEDERQPGVPLDCGVAFPYVLGPGELLRCSYAVSFPEPALASAGGRTSTVVVETGAACDVGGGSGSAEVELPPAGVVEVDACAAVTDRFAGWLGEACRDGRTFTYDVALGPYPVCEEKSVENVARLVTSDTAQILLASHVLALVVECPSGCTLTPGYWKTHAERSSRPSGGWNAVPGGPGAPFFDSGKTWIEVLWKEPQGNAYTILAHAYIAAKLNVLNGADASGVAETIAAAESFFAGRTPYGTLSPDERAVVLEWASFLDRFDNGLEGPLHCGEDGLPAS